MTVTTVTPNTVDNTPAHCHDCHKFELCHQAQHMHADTLPVHGFTDTDNCCHVCIDCLDSTDSEENLYPLDSEELDSPEHCAECGTPLIHSLTIRGVQYVREMISENKTCCCRELWPSVWSDVLPPDPHFDRFDICEAHYLYARLYGEYQTITRLHRMEFSPGLSLRQSDCPETALTENGQAIYYRLVASRNGVVI